MVLLIDGSGDGLCLSGSTGEATGGLIAVG